MRAFEEAKADLIRELRNNSINPGLTAHIVDRWASNHFDEFHISASIDMDAEKRGGADLKANLVRRACMDSALEIAAKCAHGEEEIKMPWDNRVSYRNRDYVPAFVSADGLPFKELKMSFVCLKRLPTSWYRKEEKEHWMARILK